jgi:hypothetical protein
VRALLTVTVMLLAGCSGAGGGPELTAGPGGSRYTCPAGMSMLSGYGLSGWPADVAGPGVRRFSLQLHDSAGTVIAVVVSNEVVLP